MKFIGRTKEIEKLKKEIATEKMSTTLIYGRRRVGKSELAKHLLYISDVKSIYYECRQTSEKSNVEALCESISENLNMPKLGYENMESALSFVFEYAEKEKIIFVLDEYPYLKSSVTGIDSILQALIDRYRNTSKVKLIILGSYVETMKSLLEVSNPLYGRMNLCIDVKQMNYKESAEFYPNYSEEDKVRIYSVFGGIPYYNELIDDSKSVEENIIDLIASPSARLENEVNMYLNGEISKIKNANEVFSVLAKGYSRYSDILSQSHVSSSPTLSDVLDKLVKMEVVMKAAPINDENNRKKAGYYISDNLSNFYYRYIFRFSSQLQIMEPRVFYDKYIKEDFEEKYVPKQFETICRQFLINENYKGKFNPVLEKIGKYYYDLPKEKANGEFDIVSMDERGYIFYEVKFRKAPITNSMIEEEIEQVKKTGLDCYRYVFFSRSDFRVRETDMVKHISLLELYQ